MYHLSLSKLSQLFISFCFQVYSVDLEHFFQPNLLFFPCLLKKVKLKYFRDPLIPTHLELFLISSFKKYL